MRRTRRRKNAARINAYSPRPPAWRLPERLPLRASVRVGSLFGIPLEVNASWLITLAFFVFIFGSQIYPAELDGEAAWLHWVLAAISGLFFFASIVVHELAHSVVALRSGIPVRNITLFMLGGVSQITREAKRPAVEFVMAVVGPLTSIALAGVFFALAVVPWLQEDRTSVMWQLLFWMNLTLGVVNLAPAFPLDGGRVLRSLVWAVTGSYRGATRVASLIGRGFAFALIGLGLLTLLRVVPGVSPINGVWFVLVGLFIENAARQSWAQVRVLETLRRYHAADVMQTALPVVPAGTTILETVGRHYEPRHGLCAFVLDGDDRVSGMLTDAELRHVPKDRWQTTPAGEAMLLASSAASVAPGDDLGTVLEGMEAAGQVQSPVLEDGRLVGHISKRTILDLLAPGAVGVS